MSQGDVLKLLKKERGWLTTVQISIKLKLSRGATWVALNKLYIQKLILRKPKPDRIYKGNPPLIWKLK